MDKAAHQGRHLREAIGTYPISRNEELQTLLETLENQMSTFGLFVKDQRAGCFRISARACNRVESASLFALAALFSNDGARLFRFASSFCFRCELSAL